MNRYWLKIVAGALVVFGVGLVFVRVGHRTIETVQTITDSDASISVKSATATAPGNSGSGLAKP